MKKWFEGEFALRVVRITQIWGTRLTLTRNGLVDSDTFGPWTKCEVIFHRGPGPETPTLIFRNPRLAAVIGVDTDVLSRTTAWD